MNLVSLILFVMSTIGMCHIIVDGSIFESFRTCFRQSFPKIGSLVDCYMCCGTWCGFFMGAIWISLNPFEVFACGCAGGFLSNLAAVILNYIEASTFINIPKDNEDERQDV